MELELGTQVIKHLSEEKEIGSTLIGGRFFLSSPTMHTLLLINIALEFMVHRAKLRKTKKQLSSMSRVEVFFEPNSKNTLFTALLKSWEYFNEIVLYKQGYCLNGNLTAKVARNKRSRTERASFHPRSME